MPTAPTSSSSPAAAARGAPPGRGSCSGAGAAAGAAGAAATGAGTVTGASGPLAKSPFTAQNSSRLFQYVPGATVSLSFTTKVCVRLLPAPRTTPDGTTMTSVPPSDRFGAGVVTVVPKPPEVDT